MLLKRIMPCLLLKERRLVKTTNFENPRYIGDPINAVKIYNDKEVDELIVMDILASKKDIPIDFDLIKGFASECFMPLAYGGGVRTLKDFQTLFRIGVEKVIVNTLLFDNPSIVKEAAIKFGNQSIVASVDVIKNGDGGYNIFSHSNRVITKSLDEYLEFVISCNVGEMVVTSVDSEGTWNGYDVDLIDYINKRISIPIIANGGAGCNDDLRDILYQTNVEAAAIGSMAVYQKKGMGVLIRFPKREDVINEE